MRALIVFLVVVAVLAVLTVAGPLGEYLSRAVARITLTNLAGEEISRVSVSAFCREVSSGRIAAGESAQILFPIVGEGGFVVDVSFASGRRLTSEAKGYLTPGMPMEGLIHVRENEIWLGDLSVADPRAAALAHDAADAWCGTLSAGAGVRLTGRFVKHREWGPPNFGEHPESDSTYPAWFLIPDRGVSVMYRDAEGRDRRATLLAMQVVELGGGGRAHYEALAGRHVRVDGRLEEATLPSERPPVVIYPTAVDADASVSCR